MPPSLQGCAQGPGLVQLSWVSVWCWSGAEVAVIGVVFPARKRCEPPAGVMRCDVSKVGDSCCIRAVRAICNFLNHCPSYLGMIFMKLSTLLPRDCQAAKWDREVIQKPGWTKWCWLELMSVVWLGQEPGTDIVPFNSCCALSEQLSLVVHQDVKAAWWGWTFTYSS